jgi:peptidoglycan hydrolase CwlO-like protein
MDEINSGSFTHIIGGAFIAVITLALGMQKMLKSWKETGVESSVISLMHQELERMSSQNILLATELNKLQIEVLNLNKELQKLNLENQRLQQEIVSLTIEISMLQKRLGSENK